MTMFNPNVKRVLDVGLVHTLVHDSCVLLSPAFFARLLSTDVPPLIQGRLLRSFLSRWQDSRDRLQPQHDALRHQDGRQDWVRLPFPLLPLLPLPLTLFP